MCNIGHTCVWENTWAELCREQHAVEGLLCHGQRGVEHCTPLPGHQDPQGRC